LTYLIDTNVVFEWTKPLPNSGVRSWLAGTEPDHVYLSVITLAELRYGVERMAPGRRRTALDAWIMGDLLLRFEGRILDIDFAIANEWGRFMAHSPSQGRVAGIMDTWIAATAAVYGMTVVTRDVAPFHALAVPYFNPWSGA
jgi:predicted nucleic acid-binding protein